MQQFSLLPSSSSHHHHHHLQFLLLSILSLTSSLSGADYQRYSDCAPKPYSCGDIHFNLSYPLRADGRPDYCGHTGYFLSCTNTSLTISINNHPYQVKAVDNMNHLFTIVDTIFVGQSCPGPDTYKNISLDPYFEYAPDRNRNLTLYYNCLPSLGFPSGYEIGCLLGGNGLHSYYKLDNSSFDFVLGACASTAVIPMTQTAAEQLVSGNATFGAALQMGFVVRWTEGQGWCTDCAGSGGFCGFLTTAADENTCFCPNGPAVGSCYSGSKKNSAVIIAAACAAVVGFIVACGLGFLCYRHKKRQHQIPPSTPLIRDSSFKPSLMKDPEFGRADYQTHIFSYHELQEATDHFDVAQELGDGGFGTVYKGKLRDGRTVAVKRLYDNNYKRVEQFINEVAILSRLRHHNLVTLYGCTSHQSRELLLVYEFVSNGTVADHVHGPRAAEGVLSWPLRMSIAIETAEALAYLHAIEPPIIHRDVKTNNILLDNGFHVKVADFGLSRLFPADATHVSTAPQGTPGYLDPEYHQCYQLTDKSDVYSFGVVLVELISSKQAVDVNRGRNEINLATMAVSKIQKRQLEELVDLRLGYQSDWEVKRMITLVAELAFRCLQMDRDMRPPIKEVLEVLRGVQSGEYKPLDAEEADARMRDDVGLLKNTGPFSPDSVTEKWVSRSNTSNSSG